MVSSCVLTTDPYQRMLGWKCALCDREGLKVELIGFVEALLRADGDSKIVELARNFGVVLAEDAPLEGEPVAEQRLGAGAITPPKRANGQVAEVDRDFVVVGRVTCLEDLERPPERQFGLGIDPHRGSHAAAALDDEEHLRAALQLSADGQQRQQLLNLSTIVTCGGEQDSVGGDVRGVSEALGGHFGEQIVEVVHLGEVLVRKRHAPMLEHGRQPGRRHGERLTDDLGPFGPFGGVNVAVFASPVERLAGSAGVVGRPDTPYVVLFLGPQEAGCFFSGWLEQDDPACWPAKSGIERGRKGRAARPEPPIPVRNRSARPPGPPLSHEQRFGGSRRYTSGSESLT